MKRSINPQTVLIVTVCIFITYTNSMGIEIPSPSKLVIASSILPSSNVGNYNPENAFDGDQSTAWVEGVEGNGIGEWIAVYLGTAEELAGLSEVDIWIDVGYHKNLKSFKNNGCPSKLLLELLEGRSPEGAKVLAKTSVDATVDTSMYQASGKAYVTMKVSSDIKSIVWLRTTIEDVIPGKKWHDTCISEVVPNLKKSNPHGAQEAAKLFCQAIENSDKKLLQRFTDRPMKEVVQDFTGDYAELYGISCDASTMKIITSSIFEFYAIEGQGCGYYARFERVDNSWQYKGIVERCSFIYGE